MDIGRRIKDRRKHLGISAEALAEAISASPATIYRYESGDIEHMGVDKVTPIARYLGVNEAYLMGWTEDPSPSLFNSSSSGSSLSRDEELLLNRYRSLNKEGQSMAVKYIDFLLSQGYIKNHQDRVVDEEA